MLGIIQKMFIVLLSNIVNGSNHTKCMSLRNQKCMIQLTLINVHPNEYSPDLNLSVFNMITGTNESKTLTKHIS